MNTKETILKNKLIIIARGIPTEKLLCCCEALLESGVCCIESTFDHMLENPVEDNIRKLKAIRARFGNHICLGVGTTLNVKEVQAAAAAGAEYVISPNTNEKIIAETKRLGMVSIPGAMTPSEICAAWDMGGDFIKLFPADDVGFHYIQSLKGPLPHIPMIATGGVNLSTIPQFLSAGINAVATGSSVLKKHFISREDYSSIRDTAKMYVDTIRLWDKEKMQGEYRRDFEADCLSSNRIGHKES